MLCFSTVLSKTELRIRFDQVAIFSDFIRLFELLGLGFTPYGSNAFYILKSLNITKNKAQKSF